MNFLAAAASSNSRVLRSSPRSSAAASSTTLTVLLPSTVLRSSARRPSAAFHPPSSIGNPVVPLSLCPVLSLVLSPSLPHPRAPEYHGLQRSAKEIIGATTGCGSPDRSPRIVTVLRFQSLLASQSTMDHPSRLARTVVSLSVPSH